VPVARDRDVDARLMPHVVWRPRRPERPLPKASEFLILPKLQQARTVRSKTKQLETCRFGSMPKTALAQGAGQLSEALLFKIVAGQAVRFPCRSVKCLTCGCKLDSLGDPDHGKAGRARPARRFSLSSARGDRLKRAATLRDKAEQDGGRRAICGSR
jgi:hypothetical protein